MRLNERLIQQLRTRKVCRLNILYEQAIVQHVACHWNGSSIEKDRFDVSFFSCFDLEDQDLNVNTRSSLYVTC